MNKYTKKIERQNTKERALKAATTYDAVRGFRAIVGYLKRFPQPAQRRIINAVKIVYS